MSRNLTRYFSPNPVKKFIVEEFQELVTEEDNDFVTEEVIKRKKQKVNENSNEFYDLEKDEIIPPQNGNSIKRYFARVDKASTLGRSSKDCTLTVEALVHGSPKKPTLGVVTPEKSVKGKRCKKKSGIPSSQADLIEVESAEIAQDKKYVKSIVTSSPMNNITLKSESPEKSVLKNCDDFEAEGQRCSARLRIKSVFKPVFSDEEQEIGVKHQKKKYTRKKLGDSLQTKETEVEVLSDDFAPIFFLTKKQNEAKVVKKARRDFLQSGIPEVLKQQNALQLAMKQQEVEIFPRFSHITQLDSKVSSFAGMIFLNSLKPLVTRDVSRPVVFDSAVNRTVETTFASIQNHSQQRNLTDGRSLEWHQCKEWILHLKNDRKISFPFFRTLRAMLSKDRNADEHMWSDVCTTSHWIDNMANRKSIQHLERWLKQWKSGTGEALDSALKKQGGTKKNFKRKRIDSDASETDSDVINDRSSTPEWSDSESSSNQLCHAMLIIGPAGCGKTASVYALAEELGFNVLEVNASSKRNGKSILSQLHEATQSHSCALSNNSSGSDINKFFGQSTTKTDDTRPALSLVLFEDVDIVFDPDDESFYSALSSLMNNTKRPIILTVTHPDESPVLSVAGKINSHFEILQYRSPDLYMTCGLLWTLSVVEGYPVDWDVMESFVTSCRTAVQYFDLRCLLLDLQYHLYHHPLRMDLKFNQLQLKSSEAVSFVDEKRHPIFSKASKTTAKTNYVKFIDLPSNSCSGDWPFVATSKQLRFINTAENGIVRNTNCVTDHDTRSSIVEHIRSNENKGPTFNIELVESFAKHHEDLDCLSNCLELRSHVDLSRAFKERSEVMLGDMVLWNEMEELVMNRSTLLWNSKLSRNRINASVKSRCNPAVSSTQLLLENCVSKRNHMDRFAVWNDILPLVRSICRFDLMHFLGKRRRKSLRLSKSIRLGTLDLVLPSNVVLDVANSF